MKLFNQDRSLTGKAWILLIVAVLTLQLLIYVIYSDPANESPEMESKEVSTKIELSPTELTQLAASNAPSEVDQAIEDIAIKAGEEFERDYSSYIASTLDLRCDVLVQAYKVPSNDVEKRLQDKYGIPSHAKQLPYFIAQVSSSSRNLKASFTTTPGSRAIESPFFYSDHPDREKSFISRYATDCLSRYELDPRIAKLFEMTAP